MENSIYQRITEFCEYKNLSQRELCKACNLTFSTFSAAVRRKSSLNVSVIVNILSVYSELSPDWLLLQKGSMLRDKLELSAEQSIIKELLDRNEKLIQENAVLKYRLNEKK